jgi:hypothetical protein
LEHFGSFGDFLEHFGSFVSKKCFGHAAGGSMDRYQLAVVESVNVVAKQTEEIFSSDLITKMSGKVRK